MGKPLNEFAGWLRFFQFIVMMNLMMNAFSSVTLIEALFREPDKILTIGAMMQLVFVLYLMYQILRTIPVPTAEMPEKIKDNLFYMFIIAIVHMLFYTSVTILVFHREWGLENTLTFFGAVNLMVWSAFWRTYFERSKRVKAYYSQNLDIKV